METDEASQSMKCSFVSQKEACHGVGVRMHKPKPNCRSIKLEWINVRMRREQPRRRKSVDKNKIYVEKYFLLCWNNLLIGKYLSTQNSAGCEESERRFSLSFSTRRLNESDSFLLSVAIVGTRNQVNNFGNCHSSMWSKVRGLIYILIKCRKANLTNV